MNAKQRRQRELRMRPEAGLLSGEFSTGKDDALTKEIPHLRPADRVLTDQGSFSNVSIDDKHGIYMQLPLSVRTT